MIRKLQKEENDVRAQVYEHKLIRMFIINKDGTHQWRYSKRVDPEPLGGGLT